MSSSVLENYNRSLKEGNASAVDFGEEIAPTKKPLDAYRECMERKGVLEVEFSAADEEGNLYVMNTDGVMVVLKGNDLSEDLEYYRARIKDKFLANAFSVKITDIDEENGIVYVRSSRNNTNNIRRRISNEIQGELRKGLMPHVVGRPRRIDPNKVYVDILCKGILGICNVDKWQAGFTRYIEEECSTDLVYDFVITGQLAPVPGKQAAYALSRVPFTKDPWTQVPAHVEKDSVLVVKCIDLPEGKSYWWGKSPVVQNIDIMCDYNDNIRVLAGNSYKCKVKECDRDAHILKAVPFAIADADPMSREVVRFLDSNRSRAKRSRR